VDLGILKEGTHSVQGRMNPFMSGSYMHWRRQWIEVHSADQSAQSAEKFFHLHFSVVWIGSHSTFALFTALPRPYLAMEQGGHCPPDKLAITYYLFTADSY